MTKASLVVLATCCLSLLLVTMDLTMLDVTALDGRCAVGDVATFVGLDGTDAPVELFVIRELHQSVTLPRKIKARIARLGPRRPKAVQKQRKERCARSI